MYSKKSNAGMAAKALLLTAIGLGFPTGIWAQGVTEEKADTTVVFPTQKLEEVVIVRQAPTVKLKTDKVTYLWSRRRAACWTYCARSLW